MKSTNVKNANLKNTIYIIVCAILLGGIFIITQSGGIAKETQTLTPASLANNVSVTNGKQVIEIKAKGGYSPSLSMAKADTPTIIKMKTQGTFDCSSSLVIPSIGYRGNLATSGETEIEVPPQKAGTTLQALCSMGMYNFQIKFI